MVDNMQLTDNTTVKPPMWTGTQSRQIIGRIVVEGVMRLETPAHFGSGDETGSLMTLIVDEISQKPLLTGESIAGALRSYLWTRESGYGIPQRSAGSTALLFGGSKQDEKGDQSRLIVDDAYGENAKVEMRDGVRINSASRTAEDGGLYTFMVWAAGATFNLRFELIVAANDNANDLCHTLAVALDGLKTGEITLGARKRRGYGRVTVDSWRVRMFNFSVTADLIAWIMNGGKALNDQYKVPDLFSAFSVSPGFADKRQRFTMQAHFALESSLLIRAESTVADMGHLYSNGKPVLSGTSLAGAIRARAIKIVNTLGLDTPTIIDAMFGKFGGDKSEDEPNAQATGSRIVIEEHLIEGGEAERWVQSRVSIDRFTGGALDTALFDQQPQYGGQVQISLELRNPNDYEIGLLLLVLKDLWTGDLPLGGEQSVGRGRLAGVTANLAYNGDDEQWTVWLEKGDLSVKCSDSAVLESYVSALVQRASA